MGFPNMNFFNTFTGNLDPFLEKMDKGELTLEDILNEDNIIQDIKSNNDSKFLNFLTGDKIKKLIDYSTKYPSQDEHNIGYKYPFNATEILCSENTNFQNILMEEKPYKKKEQKKEDINQVINKMIKGGFIYELFNAIKKGNKKENKDQENENESDEEEENANENEKNKNEEINIIKDKKEENVTVIYENVDYLLKFLNESDKTNENYVLVGYFFKILNNLINIHQMKIVQYLLDYPKKDELDIINLLIKHMNRKSICNIIQKLLMFDDEIIPKLNDHKIDLFSKVLNELSKTDEKNKYECICDCICTVINNRPFFDLLMTKSELLVKMYDILFKCKNNNNKYNSILKLLIKINDNILQHFPVRYTENNPENNMEAMNLRDTGYSVDKSLSSPEDNLDILKKYILALFDTIEKNKFSCFEDLRYNNDKNNNNDEFKATYLEKQKKIGMKKILQTEYLKTLIDIIVNSYASKYHENKIEQLINIAREKNIFWYIHDLFLNFPFSNIFQNYYYQILKIVLIDNSPNCIIDAFFTEIVEPKRNLIELYIDKTISDMKFNFQLTNTKSFKASFPFIITILNKIFTSQNLYIKEIVDKNKDISIFYEILIHEMNDIFTQKLLLNENFGGFGFDTAEEEAPLKTFGPQNFLERFEEDCKIYEIYKKGEDYQKALKEKKEKMEKEQKEEKKENKKAKKGIEYIDDLEEDDDPLFKVEKVNLNKAKENLNKEKENFLAILNKPTEEVINAEEDNKDIMIDNIENDGEFKNEQIGKFKELWDEDEDKGENNEKDKKKNENEKDTKNNQ